MLLARSQRTAADMIPAIRQAILQVDSGLPTFSLGTWSEALSLVTLPARAATVALGVLGGLAMMLAVTGIFGLSSYTVSKRMREFGIRVALGARQAQVLRAALQRVAVLLAVGSIAGFGLGMAASKLLASIVYQATASDPLVILAAAIAMVGIGLISGALLPAEPSRPSQPSCCTTNEQRVCSSVAPTTPNRKSGFGLHPLRNCFIAANCSRRGGWLR